MVKKSRDNFASCRKNLAERSHATCAPLCRAGAKILALCLAAAPFLLAGCNDNTTTAAGPVSVVLPPPTVHARALTDANSRESLSDPLQSAAWREAAWVSFLPPMNSRATTPPTRGAIMYDRENLYVALVANRPAVVPGDTTADSVSLYLDTHREGKELLQIAVDLNELTAENVDGSPKTLTPRFNWFRTTSPARPLDSGAPDLALPVDRFPNLKLTGIWCDVREGMDNNTPVRTAVIGVPISSLPGPIQLTPGDAPWNFNLIRVLSSGADGKHPIELQSNLSPVYIGAQFASPYRLAELQFLK